MPEAKASPTKDFFVRMITRDISLDDCILDLLDNSIDGAKRTNQTLGAKDEGYANFEVRVDLTPSSLSISDNCGGISINDATEYAFHFGRRNDAPPDADYSIGLYGIGMKRAVFKLGNEITITSSTGNEAFVVRINVKEWLEAEDQWNFAMNETDPPDGSGTVILVEDLHAEVARAFKDEVFVREFRSTIARDYSFFLQEGLSVFVNDHPVDPYPFGLRTGADFEPARYSYVDEETGVRVEIMAGLAGPLPDNPDPESDFTPNVDHEGWFVACNDRIVLAADKGALSVWGRDGFPQWHRQYSNFFGLINFRSEDANLLPWTTTKRGLDQQSMLYRRAVTQMQKLTRQFIDYTNARKDDLEAAKSVETKATIQSLRTLSERKQLELPKVSKPRVKTVSVQYSVEANKVKDAAEALGDRNLSARAVGKKTFEYFYEMEVDC